MKSEVSFLRRHAVLAYFLLTFFISWSGAFAVVAPSIIHRQLVSKVLGLIIFPVMLLGPAISGVLLTFLNEKQNGLRELFSSACRWRVEPRWYALLLLPPVIVLSILFCLKVGFSASFSPNRFYFGIFFGIPAGILEEIGWTGFAYPRMLSKWNSFFAAVVLGLLWSVWHLPAINFLGASAPHGAHWPHFFFAFALAMTAMRVLICWQYLNTKSVLLAQFMHISSTGALVVFSPPVHPLQEAMWYAIYGAALWMIVFGVFAAKGRELGAKLVSKG